MCKNISGIIISNVLTRWTVSRWQKSDPPCNRNPQGREELDRFIQISSILLTATVNCLNCSHSIYYFMALPTDCKYENSVCGFSHQTTLGWRQQNHCSINSREPRLLATQDIKACMIGAIHYYTVATQSNDVLHFPLHRAGRMDNMKYFGTK